MKTRQEEVQMSVREISVPMKRNLLIEIFSLEETESSNPSTQKILSDIFEVIYTLTMIKIYKFKDVIITIVY